MINRTYLVLMPSNASTMGFLDILPRGPVGTVAAPVRIAAGGTTPPTNWQVFGATVGDGQFCELRGRPVPFSVLTTGVPATDAANGFMPRLALGWRLDVHAVGTVGDVIPPTHQLSASLTGILPSPFTNANIFTVGNTDPTYGPAIRLLNTAAVQGRIFVVTLGIAQQRDEDRAETGL
jgi:hypothetical protein